MKDKIEICYNSGKREYYNPNRVTTHKRMGINPSADYLREVIQDVKNGYIAILETMDCNGNTKKRIFSKDIADIRINNISVFDGVHNSGVVMW